MAAPSIRGHQGSMRLYENGALVDILAITSVDVNMDSSFSRAFYIGAAVGEGDQTIEGWSGSLEMEVKDARAEVFIDALINNNLNGVGLSDYMFVVTDNYADGTSKSYAYIDCQFKLGRSQRGMGEKITKRLDFQASTRKAL